MEFTAEAIEVKDYREEEKVQMRVLKVRIPPSVKFEYRAGQYVMLAMDGFNLRANPKALKWTSYSLASSPHQNGMLEFCFKIKETQGFTQHVRDILRLGSQLHIRGPFGNFTNEKPLQNILFVATGSGIAPIMGMLRWLFNSGNDSKITLVYGFRNSDYYVYREELERYSKMHKNFWLLPTASRPENSWQGRKGYVQEVVNELSSPDPEQSQAFICGNPAMVDEMRKLLLEKGLKPEHIHSEQWEGA